MKHWYVIRYWLCIECGKHSTKRFRMYGDKPKDVKPIHAFDAVCRKHLREGK